MPRSFIYFLVATLALAGCALPGVTTESVGGSVGGTRTIYPDGTTVTTTSCEFRGTLEQVEKFHKELREKGNNCP